MIILPEIRNAVGFEEARSFIRGELKRIALLPVNASLAVYRIEVPVIGVMPLSWLAQQELLPRNYWGSADGSASIAGTGLAWESSSAEWGRDPGAWSEVTSLLDADDDLRVFAGMSFHRVLSGTEWKSFKGIHFFVPRFELIDDGSGVRLVCNVILGDGKKLPLRRIFSELGGLRIAETIVPRRYKVLERRNSPHFEQWSADIDKVLKAIASGELEKAVFCRKVTVGLDQLVDPCVFLQKLMEMPSSGHAFLFQFAEGQSFFGITPELLYSRAGDRLTSEAVAGTRSRGRDDQEDARLGSDLLSSDKDTREQQLVLSALETAFSQLCQSYQIDKKVALMKLPHQQHLVTRISGQLADGISDRELCDRLHPTPAVGGTPAKKALEYIHRMEGFDRGWYASPVGYFQKKSAKIAVAIRSCLVSGQEMNFYSGAGIVAGSEPRAEWDEAETKIRQYLDILCGVKH